jgi:hypothetical protein
VQIAHRVFIDNVSISIGRLVCARQIDSPACRTMRQSAT